MKIGIAKALYIFLLIAVVSCNSQPQKSTSDKPLAAQPVDTLHSYIRSQGKAIAKAGFQALSTALVHAIETGGVPHALDFCNVKALPITDSVSMAWNIKLARVSDKNRNPQNAANEQQQGIMEVMRKQIAASGSAHDTVIALNDRELAYYAPIIIAAPCLQCHGTPGVDVKAENNQLIQKLYPNDKATGYALGELRGMWFIRFRH